MNCTELPMRLRLDCARTLVRFDWEPGFFLDT
ncbi:hypothetical protein SAMN05428957_103286 [Oryzisolibacter propanilivorax]|uniref:Uncharacterized protein n=1 Tax=Oryzisolibacter propanilivorax TaxID=1527607 RepID=A0A1G9RHL1_9BURK|nr:hypothetical protein SAMN05428957_103286 [Oryzisolibacter propanilivorax]